MKYISAILFAVAVYYLIRLSATIKRMEQKNAIDLTNLHVGDFQATVETADALYRDYMFGCFNLDAGKIMRSTMLMERFFLSIDVVRNEKALQSEWIDILSELEKFCARPQDMMAFWTELNARYTDAWNSFDVRNIDHVKFVFSHMAQRPISFSSVVSNIMTSAKKNAIISIYGKSFYSQYKGDKT